MRGACPACPGTMRRSRCGIPENWYFEDFTPGDKIRSIRRTISEGESMLFNSLVMDHHPYVSDEAVRGGGGRFRQAARGRGHGVQLRAGAGGDELASIRFPTAYDRLRFIAPVFIGDTIYTIRENLSKEVKDLTMGKVRVSYSVFKGEGEQVLYCEHLMTALYRDPAPFRAEAETAMAAKEAARRG